MQHQRGAEPGYANSERSGGAGSRGEASARGCRRCFQVRPKGYTLSLSERPMRRSSLLISTIALIWALGCGGRESGALGGASGSSSGTHGGASAGTNGSASGGPNGGGSADTNGGGSAGIGSGGSISATTGSVAMGGGPCLIVQPSSYDQSCSADKDCVLVSPGATSCDLGCRCGNATVNANAQAQYNKDLARALALAGPGVACPCPPPVATMPYCHAGTWWGGRWAANCLNRASGPRAANPKREPPLGPDAIDRTVRLTARAPPPLSTERPAAGRAPGAIQMCQRCPGAGFGSPRVR